MTRSDQELVDAASAGDGSAFGELVRRHDRMLRALAFQMLGSREAMDDALQDAYVKAHRALAGFRGEASVGSWLYGITYRTCLDHLRAARRRPTTPLDDGHQARVADPRDRPGGVEDRLRLQAALDGLSAEHRAVVLAIDVAGLSYDEVSEQFGLARGTVASRLNRAREALRVALSAAGDTKGRP